MTGKFELSVRSEVGKLEGVIVHSPGSEVQNMTPENAERALYSDILNLKVAEQEYNQFQSVLDKYTRTFQVKDLLKDVLVNEKVKEDLIERVCKNEHIYHIKEHLVSLDANDLSKQLVEGVICIKDNLTKFLSKERYALMPLHNFFYTRDASITIKEHVLIGRMASKVRDREALIMETIFDYHPNFNTKTFNSARIYQNHHITLEGGDILVARDDILLIGIGSRTTSQGVDQIIEHFRNVNGGKMNIIVQELPFSPESFIHLDMVFTLLDRDKCMAYEPLILKNNKYQTVHIQIDNKAVKSIKIVENIPHVLKSLGMEVEMLFCGGKNDTWIQEREQWHSGANFFALAPGKVIGYGRNLYTIEELNKNGFEVIEAEEIIKGQKDAFNYKQCVITIEGSELARGGGGARCMTMPVKRKAI